MTFRLADSLPASVLRQVAFERGDILKRAEQQHRKPTVDEVRRLDALFAERIDHYLDAGTGSCYLARPEIAGLVADALRYFDGQRYRLDAWCVMPNHVHVLFTLFAGERLEKILHSWKSFTANRAGQILARTGRFWQREYYDRLVRGSGEFAHFIGYIVENPLRAKLESWKWVWVRSG